MRAIAPLLLLFSLAPYAAAEDKPANEAVVKDVRALLSAVKDKDVASAKQKLFARSDLDWPSVKQGLMQGRYYQTPLVTNFGTRHSGKDLRLRLTGRDGKERGFSLYLPKSYDAKAQIPVLLYLHHDAGRAPEPEHGATLVHSALLTFRDAAEEHGILFVAPYTSRGAEWWRPEGRRLVEWTLQQVKELYNIDEDRVALMGAMDGAEGVWYMAQELPGLWSCMLPMSGDPYEITGLIRPLYLGTLDRMDVLMGVPAKIRGTLGNKNATQFLQALKPMIDKGMRLTTVIAPSAQGDFRYLERVRDDVMSWVKTKKRKALAEEVDIETDSPSGTRGLWLETHGVDAEGDVSPHLPSTRLVWTPPKRPANPHADAGDEGDAGDEEKEGDGKAERPRMGVDLGGKPKEWEFGLPINKSMGAADREGIVAGDILVEIAGTKITKKEDAHKALDAFKWGDEVKVIVLREVKESEVKRMAQRQRRYMKFAAMRTDLRNQGKTVPANLIDSVPHEPEEAGGSDDGAEDEDDDSGKTVIDDGGDDGALEDDSEKTHFFPMVRFLQLNRPGVGGHPIRADFGANFDHAHKDPGAKVTGLYAGGLAQRSGFLDGDVIVAIGSEPVNKAADLRKFFGDFKFEGEKKGEQFAEFTVKRSDGEHTIHVSWDPPVSSRVDVKWSKKEKMLTVMVRHANRFTVYFTDELIPPGEPFHLYINGIPYQDLASPESRPDYPVVDVGTDPFMKEELFSMRQKRAKVDGWTPDLKWAVENALERRDRALIMGAKRTYDLAKLAKGFASWREREAKIKAQRAAKAKQAYEAHKSKGS